MISCALRTEVSAPSSSAPAGAEEAKGQSAKETCAKPQAMGRKNDLVVWLKLQPMQRRIYEVGAPYILCCTPDLGHSGLILGALWKEHKRVVKNTFSLVGYGCRRF